MTRLEPIPSLSPEKTFKDLHTYSMQTPVHLPSFARKSMRLHEDLMVEIRIPHFVDALFSALLRLTKFFRDMHTVELDALNAEVESNRNQVREFEYWGDSLARV